VALKVTFLEMCGPKLQFIWQRVDTHPAIFFDLKLICRGLQGPESSLFFSLVVTTFLWRSIGARVIRLEDSFKHDDEITGLDQI
jgi:hypothetical protein